MNQELFVEIFTEEIPARMQLQAQKDAHILFAQLLSEHGVVFESVRTYVAPQRLVMHGVGVKNTTQTKTEIRRGPKIGAPEAALNGFLKSTNLTKNQLVETDGYWTATIHELGQALEAVLPKVLHRFLDAMPWPKSMRWYNPKTQTFTRPWVRPIRSILCLYAGETVEFHVDGLAIKTSNVTRGHRFLAPHTFTVNSFDDYKEKLENAFVILDHQQRQNRIVDQMETALQDPHYKHLEWQKDPTLLEEVAGLADWPCVQIEAIDQRFIHLPPVALATSLKNHQKCFTLFNRQGSEPVATHFAMVFNTTPNALMVAGVQKVLRARLNDALFFYDVDLKTSFDDLLPQLDHIVYHQKLGSLGQKVKRLETLMTSHQSKTAARICKVDLLTQMVGEFPELQGIMGEIYAVQKGYAQEIAAALREHYLPQGPSDPCPTSDLSAQLSLWDKLDTLVGFLGVGIKPTGSKDPFALRRSALGVLRLLVENGKKGYNLNEAIQRIICSYEAQGVALSADTEKESVIFIQDRLAAYLKEDGVTPEELQAVLKVQQHNQIDLWSLVERVRALSLFIKTPEGLLLRSAYKRSTGILEKGQGGAVQPSLLQETEEKNLYEALHTLTEKIDNALRMYDFEKVMAFLSTLKGPIDAFFEAITVNCDDEKLRQNRYALLGMFVEKVNRIANLSCLQ